MAQPLISSLEKMIGTPRDGALLRYSLGTEYLKTGDRTRAIEHLREAVQRDPDYSAAWKLLGRALAEDGDTAAAIAAFEHGIAVARARGDEQAMKEMGVFLRRLQKQGGA